MSQAFDPLVLDTTLWNFATDKFVKATLRADGIEMPVSPVNVPHIANGIYVLYDPLNIFFPDNINHVSIVYSVYHDAAFTQRSLVHAPDSEHYTKDNPIPGGDPNLIKKINQLIDIVTSHDVNSQVVGVIEDDVILVGTVMPDDAIGAVFDDVVLTGFVLDNNDPVGNIFDESDLIGTID